MSSYLLKALDSMEPALLLRALFEGRGIRRRAESGSSASINRMDSGSMLSLYSRTTHSIMFFHPDFSESPYLQCCTHSTATFKPITFFFCGIFCHVPPANVRDFSVAVRQLSIQLRYVLPPLTLPNLLICSVTCNVLLIHLVMVFHPDFAKSAFLQCYNQSIVISTSSCFVTPTAASLHVCHVPAHYLLNQQPPVPVSPAENQANCRIAVSQVSLQQQ